VFQDIEFETESEDEGINQLVGSSIGEDVDGDVGIFLSPDEETWTPERGLRLTAADALELRAMLGEAAEILAGSSPQRFIRLMICEPWSGLEDLQATVAGMPNRAAAPTRDDPEPA
jgi:hypothetical protein